MWVMGAVRTVAVPAGGSCNDSGSIMAGGTSSSSLSSRRHHGEHHHPHHRGSSHISNPVDDISSTHMEEPLSPPLSPRLSVSQWDSHPHSHPHSHSQHHPSQHHRMDEEQLEVTALSRPVNVSRMLLFFGFFPVFYPTWVSGLIVAD